MMYGYRPDELPVATARDASLLGCVASLSEEVRQHIAMFVAPGRMVTLARLTPNVLDAFLPEGARRKYMESAVRSAKTPQSRWFTALLLRKAGFEEREGGWLEAVRTTAMDEILRAPDVANFAVSLFRRGLIEEFHGMVEVLPDPYLKAKFRIIFRDNLPTFKVIVGAGGSFEGLLALQTAKLYFLRDHHEPFIKVMHVAGFDQLLALQTAKFYYMVKHAEAYIETMDSRGVSLAELSDLSYPRFYDMSASASKPPAAMPVASSRKRNIDASGSCAGFKERAMSLGHVRSTPLLPMGRSVS